MSVRCKKCDSPFPDHETRGGLCLSCLWAENMELREKVYDLIEKLTNARKLSGPTWGEEPNEE